MSYHYLDATRADDPHALSDVEVFQQGVQPQPRDRLSNEAKEPGFYFAYLDKDKRWSSDPSGPFDTESAALAAARLAAGWKPPVMERPPGASMQA